MLCLALLLPAFGNAQVIDVGRFTLTEKTIPAPWKTDLFSQNKSKTQYRLREWDGVTAIEAYAQSSMALLARPLHIDLFQTPVLCWRWRIDSPLKKANMAHKSGDDYAARVYVALTLPKELIGVALRAKLTLARKLFGAQVPDAAINYVWDNRHPIGFEAPNAYTDQARMVVLESGAELAGRWVEERRDVLADAHRLFGTNQITTTLLAIASDTDDTGENARAGFADLHFVERTQSCVFSNDAR